MAYMHIDNLYKAQEILLFKECYAMEKIHGSSAHVSFNQGKLGFFAGGCKHEDFVALFDESQLAEFCNRFLESKVIIYGEVYGGKLQGMSDTYGNSLRFIVFEVKIGEWWLDVPKAEEFATNLGFDFVSYRRIPTDLRSLDAERDADSIQAQKNGCGSDKKREGIVLRPLIEATMNNGKRIIAKHKALEFRETSTPRQVDDKQLKILTEAKAIANEWVTFERLNHILNRGTVEISIQNTGKIIALMNEDILREAEGEIEVTPQVIKEINRSIAIMFKQYLNNMIAKA
jgi:hypothetical protein